MASLLGAAKVLADQKDQLRGSVKFIFQPAEEYGGGAKFMIQRYPSRDACPPAYVYIRPCAWMRFRELGQVSRGEPICLSCGCGCENEYAYECCY